MRAGQLPRQSEHGMDVASGQQFPFARWSQRRPRVAAGILAMPVSTRVYEMVAVCPQAGAAVAMPTQRGGAERRWPATPSGVAS